MVLNGSYHQTMNPGHLEITFGLNTSKFGIIYMMKEAEIQPKTHFFLKNEGYLGQMVAFNNSFYHYSIRYCISDEIPKLKLFYNESYGQKGQKTAKNTFFRRKCVIRVQIWAIR